MNAPDLIRYLIFVFSGIGVGFMIMTNIIAYKVLRPPKRLGFLWWHVTSISLSFLMVGAVALDNVVGRIGEPFTWRTPMLLAGSMLFATAQVIIFGVERNRLVQKVAQIIIDKSGP